jgi:hypothetical protein
MTRSNEGFGGGSIDAGIDFCPSVCRGVASSTRWARKSSPDGNF